MEVELWIASALSFTVVLCFSLDRSRLRNGDNASFLPGIVLACNIHFQ